MDITARNAFYTHPYPIYQGSDRTTKFSGITDTDRMATEVLEQIWLKLNYRSMPWNQLPNPQAPTGMVCITSPGVIHDLRKEANATEGRGFIDKAKYADPSRLMRYTIGEYMSTTFISNPMAVLWNAGAITHQAKIKAPVAPIDGAPDPTQSTVHGVYYMGQNGQSGQKHYIQLDAGDAAEFSVGDKVTLHVSRTNANGVTGGVDYTDPLLVNTIVVAVNTVDDRISVEKPVQVEYSTDLGSGVYGYVTKGLHIHTAVFLASNEGVHRAVARAPRIMFPPAFDDAMAMRRITWDAYYGEAVFQPETFEVWFGSASYSEWSF